MPLLQWALALANNAGRSGGTDVALATVSSLPQLDERSLVIEAQAGNRPAFEELVRRFGLDVLRVALNMINRPEDGRDFYQESSLKFYRNRHRFLKSRAISALRLDDE